MRPMGSRIWRRWRARALAALTVGWTAGAVLPGCGSPTELWLLVDSNVRSGREDPRGLRAVRIEVSVDDEASPFFSQSHDLNANFALPGFKRVSAPRGQESRRARVRVTGTLADGTELRQTAVAAFGAGRRLRLDLFLASECAGAVQLQCEAMGQTCGRGGLCTPIERSNLDEYAGAIDAGAIE
jgi:hypothetical protein